MNEETTVPSTAAVTEAAEPPATEVPETVPETTDGTVAVETTVPDFVLPGADPTEDTSSEGSQETTMETILEDFSGAAIDDTLAETTELAQIVDVIETVGSDLAHINLFGAFLIAGTLIGLQLLRDRHGN